MSLLSPLAEARERGKARRHHEWRQKPQDMLVVFTGIIPSKVRTASARVARNARRSGIAVLGKPERRANLPPGHPPMLGIEDVDPVIMTITLHCSMAQVVDLLDSYMPDDMAVVPIPSERCNVR